MPTIYLDVTADQLARHQMLQANFFAEDSCNVERQPYIRICMQAKSSEELRQQLIQLILDESVQWVLAKQRHRFLLLQNRENTLLIIRRVRQRVNRVRPQLQLLIEYDLELLQRCSDDKTITTWNIDGYLQFSAKNLKWAVENILQEECEAFQEEQDREEFISLLQFCVSVQPSLLDDVYLTLQANQFTMMDVWGNDLQQIYLDALPKDEYADVQMHDLILSILMTMLPKTIHLFVHMEQMTEAQQLQQERMVQLLQQIFSDRVILEG